MPLSSFPTFSSPAHTPSPSAHLSPRKQSRVLYESEELVAATPITEPSLPPPSPLKRARRLNVDDNVELIGRYDMLSNIVNLDNVSSGSSDEGEGEDNSGEDLHHTPPRAPRQVMLWRPWSCKRGGKEPGGEKGLVGEITTSLHKRQALDHLHLLPTLDSDAADHDASETLPEAPFASTSCVASHSYKFVDKGSSFANSTLCQPSILRAGGPWISYPERKVPSLCAIDIQLLSVIAATAYQVLKEDSWFDQDLHLLQGFD